MKKPAIPSTQGVSDRVILSLLAPIKENIETMTGIRGGVIAKLPATTTDLSVIVGKINEIIVRLNAHD